MNFILLNIKKIFKDWKHFIIVILSIFLFLTSLLTFSFVNETAKNKYNDYLNNSSKYQYYLDKSIRDDSSESSFLPYSIFGSSYVKYVDNGKKENLFSLKIGNGTYFNPTQNDIDELVSKGDGKIIFNTSNTFLDLLDKNEFIKEHKKMDENSFSYYLLFLKKSTIESQINSFFNNAYVYYLNNRDYKDSFVQNDVAKQIYEKLFNSNIDENKIENCSNLNDVFEIGTNSKIGITYNNYSNYIFGTKQNPAYKFSDVYNFNNGISLSNFFVGDNQLNNNVYNNDNFETLFYVIASEINNFDYNYLNSFIYSNKNENLTYEFIQRDDTNKQNLWNLIKNPSSVKLKIINEDNKTVNNFSNSVIISQKYFVQNSLRIGQKIYIHNDIADTSFVIAGSGYDYNNDYYPSIYDEDIIPDSKHNAFVYISSEQIHSNSFLTKDFIKNNSKHLFNYEGNDFSKDEKSLELMLASNYTNVNQKTNISALNDNVTVIKNNAFEIHLLFFQISSIIAIVACYVYFCFVMFIRIRNKLSENRANIGILKANGMSNFDICLNAVIKVAIPSIIASILAYVVSIFLSNFLSLKLFQNFEFNINLDIHIALALLIILLVNVILIMIVWIATYKFVLNDNLDLIYGMRKRKTKEVNRGNKLKYSNKLAFKLFISNKHNIISNSVLSFLLALVTSILISIPFQIFTVKNDYYKNINYQNNQIYKLPMVNNPLVWTNEYNTNSTKGDLIQKIIGIEKNNDNNIDYLKENLLDSKIWPDTSSDDSNNKILKNYMCLNAIDFLGKDFSINDFDQYINKLTLNDVVKTDESGLTNVLNNIFSKICVDMNIITDDEAKTLDWKDCLLRIAIKEMPKELLGYWTSKEKRENFDFSFNSILEEKDDVNALNLPVNINDSNFDLIGIPLSSSLKFDVSNLKDDELVVTKSLAASKNIKKGDNLAFDYNANVLQYKDSSGDYQTLNPNDFVYIANPDDINNSLIDSALKHDVNASSFVNDNTIKYLESKTSPIKIDSNYYVDENGNYIKCDSKQNFFIKLKTSDANNWKSTIQTISNKSKDLINREFINSNDGYTYVRLYDDPFNFNNVAIYPNASGDVLYNSLFANENWDLYSTALKNGDLQIKTVTNTLNYKVAKIIDVYDQKTMFTNINSLSEKITGVQNIEDKFFNSKYVMSNKNSYLESISFYSSDSYAPLNIANNGINLSTTQIDLISTKKDIINKVFIMCVSIIAPFLIIVIYLAVETIIEMTKMFIKNLQTAIAMLNTLGYSNNFIYGMIMKITLPLFIASITIGSFIMSIVMIIINDIVYSQGIALPLSMLIIPNTIIFIFIVLIYFAVTTKIFKTNIKKHIQQKISQNN